MAACKVLQYIASTSSFLSPYPFAIASIDRFFSSSTHTRVRRLSSISVSHWSISTLLIFTTLFFINVLALHNLRDDELFSLECAILYALFDVSITRWFFSHGAILICLHYSIVSIQFRLCHPISILHSLNN